MQKEIFELLEGMTGGEARLLIALAWMCEQYLADDKGELDHMCMSAGERAVELLTQYKLLEPVLRGGTRTELGRALLELD